VIVAHSSTTRSGVQNQCRPMTAWRPSGPPTILLARAASGSVQLGTTRCDGVNERRSTQPPVEAAMPTCALARTVTAG
jgi:hypothetical protein